MPSTEPGSRLTPQERLILLVLATVQFTSIVDFMVIMPLAPELKRAIGLTTDRFAMVVAAYTLAAGLAGLISTLLSATMLSNGGRMVPAMAMITSSVVPRLRGGFMGANSAIQHLSSSFGVIIAGFILFEPKNGPIERYTFVGLMAAMVSLSTLWLAGRLRLEGGAANELALEPVKSQISAAHGQEIGLKPAGTTRGVLSREDRVAPASAHT